jgi:ribonuclease P protein component
LSKKNRIKNKKDFEENFKKGKRLFGSFYIVIYKKNDFSYPRIGVSVSKKVGKAHKRNYEKRLIRDFFRKKKYLLENYDIIFIKNKNEGTFREKEKDFDKLTHNLLKKEDETKAEQV